MAETKRDIQDDIDGESVEAALQVEENARRSPVDWSKFTLTFARPFTYEGETYEQLDFDFYNTTGNDFANSEDDVLREGKTVVMHPYSTRFLAAFAARACTYRNKEGRRTVSYRTLMAMPSIELYNLTTKVRNFFLSRGL